MYEGCQVKWIEDLFQISKKILGRPIRRVEQRYFGLKPVLS